MGTCGRHAVVIGASMSGLLAARALLGPYDRVTVLDRDALGGEGPRRGVPQGQHFHGVMARGVQIFEAMFPGILAEIEAAGAPFLRDWTQYVMIIGGHRFAPGPYPVDPAGILVSRPFLESRVRGRLEALPGVEIAPNSEVIGLIATADGARVTGVRVVSDGAESALAADLVLDASGRSGRAPVWLAGLGYGTVAEERVEVDVKYVSQFVELPPGALGAIDFVIHGAWAGMPRASIFGRLEQGRWLISTGGYSPEHHPPTEETAFREYAAALLPSEAAAIVRNAPAAGPVLSHRFPTSLRRHYEKLDRFPAGFLVLGDAVCSFNPLYGQGMTTAALQAQSLRACLLHRRAGTDDLARRYFTSAAKPVDLAWQLATGGDLAIPSVPGRRTAATRVLNGYVERLMAAAEQDIVVGNTFWRVAGFLDPPAALFAPAMLRRILGRRPPAAPGPAAAEPPARAVNA